MERKASVVTFLLCSCAPAAAQENPSSAEFHARHNSLSPAYVGSLNEQKVAVPPGKWEERWGAFASDENGVYGIVSDMTSKRKAKRAAVEECKSRGGGQCVAVATYANQCVAMVASDVSPHTVYEQTEEGALEAAQKKCSDSKQKNCHVFYSGCSLPVRAE